MGSKRNGWDEKPVHRATVTEFAMTRTEVTVGQYRKCVSAGCCTEPDGSEDKAQECCNWWQPDREDYPVDCVDWQQAQAFAVWAGGRLPTEAEWEYVAKSGQTDDLDFVDVAWCGGGIIPPSNSTHPVGLKKANTWGLYDMFGNAEEWVQDWYGRYPVSPVIDPFGPTLGSDRVVRGRCFGWVTVTLRVHDFGSAPNRGFRIARSIK